MPAPAAQTPSQPVGWDMSRGWFGGSIARQVAPRSNPLYALKYGLQPQAPQLNQQGTLDVNQAVAGVKTAMAKFVKAADSAAPEGGFDTGGGQGGGKISLARHSPTQWRCPACRRPPRPTPARH
jgi:hypothetical protein